MRFGMITLAADGQTAVVHFSEGTKTSARKVASSEALVVRDPITLHAVRLLLDSRGDFLDGDYASGLQPARFISLFQRAVKFLDLTAFSVRPYSVRRGGATHHFRLHGNMAETVVRGRWASAKPARIYIEDGLASLAQINLSTRQVADFKVYRNTFLRHCA